MVKSNTENVFNNGFIDVQPFPAAFIDLNFRFADANNLFKELFNKNVTGEQITELLLVDLNSIHTLIKKQSYKFYPEGENSFFEIFPLFEQKRKSGYLITYHDLVNPVIIPRKYKALDYNSVNKVWEKVASLLVSDSRREKIINQILSECICLSKSDYGLYVSLNENQSTDENVFVGNQDYDVNPLIAELKFSLKEIRDPFISSHYILLTKKNKSFLKEKAGKNNLLLLPSYNKNELAGICIFGSDKVFSTKDIFLIGQITILISLSINIVEMNRINKNLENKSIQSQKLDTIAKLSSGIAHDLNNLLSGIFGSLNLLKKKLTDNTGVTYLLENLESCSIRAAELTKGLLNYGKPTPKRRILLKPGDLLKELLIIIRQSFPDDVGVITKIDNDLNDISGNATEIYRILFNLLINAKDAIKGKGEIILQASNYLIENNSNEYPLLKPGSYVKFSVKDSGEGISEENLSKIFEPYFTTKGKENGTGLGLYITYGIIKAHNGYIDVKSKLNEGTQFDVFIPAYDKNLFAGIQTEKIILLADDEIMLRDLLAELLESYNYHVICVQNGREVIKVLTEEIKVDLLIIDYKMPEMDGITCINKIREFSLDLPIILSTGSTSDEIEMQMEKLNVNCILRKPYQFEQMLHTVKSFM